MIALNKVIIAAAGSGKTTHLVREALNVVNGRVVIATYTESNEDEIKRKFFELCGFVPANVTIVTWFKFLIANGVRPFQGNLFKFGVKGMILVDRKSGLRYVNSGHPVYWGEKDFERHYFDSEHRVYSDKLPKLVIRCDDASQGSVVDRVSRIYSHIFIDEVQDLAGYDLDIVARFFACGSNVMVVGDPRQVTYQTHHESRHTQYSWSKIVGFFRTGLPTRVGCEIDEDSLAVSHRNNAAICRESSKLFPAQKAASACTCADCRARNPRHAGVFVLRRRDVGEYVSNFQATQLRYNITTDTIKSPYGIYNFGEAKGRGFDRVVIYPTSDMVSWIKDHSFGLKEQTRSKLYVALTRARHSAAIVYDFADGEKIDGFETFSGPFAGSDAAADV